jgi:hypothetical protein
MKNETRNILETPFTRDQIKQRKGLWGKTLDYIEGHNIIARLNMAFENDWSFTVVEHHIMDTEVIVLGQLRVQEIIKQQFGSSGITRDSKSGDMLCLGDDLKSAATDSLKKAASLMGVGLHLYGDYETTIIQTSNDATTPRQSESKPVSSGKDASKPRKTSKNNKTSNTRNTNTKRPPDNGNNNGNGNGNGNGRITPKQMRYILSLGRRQNLHNDAVEKLAVDWFGTPLSRIEKTQASEMITQLSA